MIGYIIINFRNNGVSPKTANKVKRLTEEFNLLGVEIKTYPNDGSLAFVDSNGEIVLNIKRPDFIIYLDKDKYLARMLEKVGIPLFNSSEFIELCDDKMLTHIHFSKHNIPMPKTVAGPLIFDSSTYDENEDKMLYSIKKRIGFPLIIKGVYGSLGTNMVFVQNEKEFKSKYLLMRGQPLLFQQYIDSSFGKSVRVIVIDNKIFGAFERYNPNDFRSNYHEGASSKPFIINEDVENIVNKIIKVTDIPYAGVDLLFGKDGMLFCEINSNAFFFEFEKVTGLNVAKAFAEMVIKKLK